MRAAALQSPGMSDGSPWSTPVGRLVWQLLEQVGVKEPAASGSRSAAAVTLEGIDETTLERLQRDLEGARVVSVEMGRPDELFVVLGRDPWRWALRGVAGDGGATLTTVDFERALPDGVDVRRAVPADSDQILAVCRNTPIVLGDVKLYIDPGDDYFAALQLMEAAGSMVATYHSRVVAVQCGTAYEVRLDGRHQRMAQVLHTRVLPEFNGLGLFSILSKVMRSGQWLVGSTTPGRPRTEAQERAMAHVAKAHGAARDSSAAEPEGGRRAERQPLALNNCMYFGVGNEAIRRNLAVPPWRCRPERAVISCRDSPIETSSGVRPATPDDAERIVAILNACHTGEELFLEYTPEFLEARVSRSPDYGWGNFLMAERAVVGVWYAGQRRTIVTGTNAERTTRALVLDYGFLPGAEEELRTLLDEAGSQARKRGMTHLSVFTSKPSPGYSVVTDAAESIEEYDLVTPLTPEPEGTRARGVYVDQIYF